MKHCQNLLFSLDAFCCRTLSRNIGNSNSRAANRILERRVFRRENPRAPTHGLTKAQDSANAMST